ncbi:unnamed protein product [Gongylonema pulchrum]|uniref:ubiquitinyl hydrolase 1 n=1 Tax=Gongylonema pulchrum TaxID=637853 RepID=A0A3P7M913_9BILA|nr:unnamed protein product [Gongylonema pulchrum]
MPYDEQGTVVEIGYTGLRNIGNTCFMNSTLQMLVNCKELQIYFGKGYYKKDINKTNPLGFSGRLAEVFAEFMNQMWNGMNRVYEPTKIKELVAEKATQFANFAQHDAHEFLSFVLDGLHEDLNRIRAKPTTNTTEAEGRPDIEISITFDPFVYLAVPFPKEKRSSTVYFWPLDPCLKPVKITVRYNADGKVVEVLDALSRLVNVNPRARLLFRKSIKRACANCLSTDVKLKACERKLGQVVVEPYLIIYSFYRKVELRDYSSQHGLFGAKICRTFGDFKPLLVECQLQHWQDEHRLRCKTRTQADVVGQPFIISLPKKRATYSNVMRNLESRCKHSVNVFQPPVENNDLNGDTLESVREGLPELVPPDFSSSFSSNTDDSPASVLFELFSELLGKIH